MSSASACRRGRSRTTRRPETAYTLNWLPIGGFVRLEGEDGDHADDPAELRHKPLKMRTIILLAGVAMNLLLAFVIFVFIAGFADPSVDIRVNGLAPATTSGAVAPAVAAGLTAGQADRRHRRRAGLRRHGRRHHGHRRPAVRLLRRRPDGRAERRDPLPAGPRRAARHALPAPPRRHDPGRDRAAQQQRGRVVGAARQRRHRPGRTRHRRLLVPAGAHDRARPARRHQPGSAAHGHGGGHGRDRGRRPARQPGQPAGGRTRSASSASWARSARRTRRSSWST